MICHLLSRVTKEAEESDVPHVGQIRLCQTKYYLDSIGTVSQHRTLIRSWRKDNADQKAKIMLMRVGFEPTPFRTSDCDEPEGNTLS